MVDYKIVVFGSGSVGKSCIVVQYVQGQFVTVYDPTIEDSYFKRIAIGKQEMQLEILDTAGQEDFAALRTCYMRQSQGFILVYSIDDRSSFEEIETIYQDIIRTKDKTSFSCIICGNKSDLEDRRVVTVAEGEDLAEKLHCHFIETSALSNSNIDELFTILCKDLLKLRNHLPDVEVVHEVDPISTDCCLLI